jgi:hypothetical protein
MKSVVLKRVNLTMAIKWLVFLPVILPLCIVFGALKGVLTMLDKMTSQMMTDIES